MDVAHALGSLFCTKPYLVQIRSVRCGSNLFPLPRYTTKPSFMIQDHVCRVTRKQEQLEIYLLKVASP